MVYAFFRNINSEEKDTSITLLKKWIKENGINIDEIVFDDDIKQNTPLEERQFCTYLLPKIKDGDIIVSTEVSCIGRSAIELDNVFNNILCKKNIRVICISMDIDINYGSLSLKGASELKNISFAAKLYKQLVHETTKASLALRKKRGVKLGAASEKYKKNQAQKGVETIKKERERSGHSRSVKYLKSKNVQTFFEICRRIYGTGICDGNPIMWDWDAINTKRGKGDLMLTMLQEYKRKDPELYETWDISRTRYDLCRLSAILHSIRRSIENMKNWDEFKDQLNEEYERKKIQVQNGKQTQGMLQDLQITSDDLELPITYNGNYKEDLSDDESNIIKYKVNIDKLNEESSIKISEKSISKFKKKNEPLV